jgi:hypothetical protein
VKQPIISVLCVTLVLAGCVSQQSQNALASLQAGCAAGNRDACSAAAIQLRANQQELNSNTAVAAGIGAALFGAAVVGVAIAEDGDHRGYGPEHRHGPDYRHGSEYRHRPE